LASTRLFKKFSGLKMKIWEKSFTGNCIRIEMSLAQGFTKGYYRSLLRSFKKDFENTP